MRDVLRQMRPDRFEDLIAGVALYRPGPMANIPAYCQRKHGEKWEAPHPEIRDILEETYGIMVYQEQVMQIAQRMAGFSLGEADLLRRAMGKKIRCEMEAQRKSFLSGAVGARHRGGQGRGSVRADGAASPITASTNRTRRLCAGRLPDRVDEGEPSGGVPRRLHVARDEQHRPARRRCARKRRAWASAVLPPDINRSGADFTPGARRARRTLRPLRAGRGEEAWGWRRCRRWWRHVRHARSPTSPTSRRASIRGCSTACSSKTWCARAPSMRWSPIAPACSPAPR